MNDDWRPIETAPRDGTIIEVMDPDCGRVSHHGDLQYHWGKRRPRMSKEAAVAKAIREEIVRQYRDNDRARCPAGLPFWEEEVQPMLLAEVAIAALSQSNGECP